ncbi:MAG: ParB/RepB/Spo0J family partition protein [Patescibacteria group bacterium]
MANNQGLGRGLSSLIPTRKGSEISGVAELLDHEKILKIKTENIEANPMQPRGRIDHGALEDLINSIKEHGILQPLIVSRQGEGYILIAGERRLRSAKILGLKTVPAIVRDTSRQEKLEIALVENLQRKNLNAIEEAMAYKKLVDEFNLNQEQVAKRVGKSRETVANTLRLLSLPLEIQKSILEEKISEGHAKAILSLSSEKQQLKLLNTILKSNLSVRKTEGYSRQIKRSRFSATEPDIIEKEDLLRENLGTRVKIDKKGGRGKITIEFYSEAELNQIVNNIIK